jgi:uncharacterized membrane protein required for colicin V production
MDVMVNYGIYGLVAALALLGFLAGYVRGVMRQLVRIITVAASFGLAFVLTLSLKDAMLSFFDGKTLAQLLTPMGVAIGEGVWLNNVTAETVETVITLPAGLVIMPLVFLVLFILISFVMLLVHKMLSGIVGFTKRNNNLITRALGAIAGAAQGAAVALVILIPVSGMVSSFAGAVSYVEEKYPDKTNSQALVSTYNQYLKASEGNVALNIVKPVADAMYPSFSVYEVYGKEMDMRDCVTDAAVVLVNLGDIAATDWAELSESDKAALSSMVDIITENDYFAVVASGIFKALGEASAISGGLFDFPEPLGSFMDYFMNDVMRTSTRENIGEDFDTLLEVLYLLSDSGTLRTLMEGGDALASFTAKDEDGEMFLNKFTATFDKNPRMSGVLSAVNKLAFEMLLQNKESSLPSVEVIDSVKTGINDTLAIDKETFETHEEYREAVNDSLHTTLEQNDIELDEEQMDKITDYVINEMDGVTEVTDADIADFIARYYEVYAEKMKTEAE